MNSPSFFTVSKEVGAALEADQERLALMPPWMRRCLVTDCNTPSGVKPGRCDAHRKTHIQFGDPATWNPDFNWRVDHIAGVEAAQRRTIRRIARRTPK